MKRMKILLVGCLAWCLSWTAAQAMSVERVGADLYATGPTVSTDFVTFKAAFAQEGIERLILVNGPGGDLWTGMQVARMVQAQGIQTVASGSCVSACSLIFIAGKKRAFGTGHLPRNTLVGIHGAHDNFTKQVNPQHMPQMYAFYKQQMGEKFDDAVIGQALYDMKDASGLLTLRELERNRPADRVPVFCPSRSTPRAECVSHTQKDAFSLGVITQEATEPLNLPKSMQLAYGFFGRKLTEPQLDQPERGQALVAQMCEGRAPCEDQAAQLMDKYLSAPNNRAMAIGLNSWGYGSRWDMDEPGAAMLMALYQCNHVASNPKLCRLVTVNDHELLPYYKEVDEQAAQALARLPVPEAVEVHLERAEIGTSTPDQFNKEANLFGMTPARLHGITRVDTAQLAQMLTKPHKPVLIDVGLTGGMLPGALNMIHAGLALPDEVADAALNERFRRMLKAAAPDLQQPVVFYCGNSECWQSVNAAMRAQRLGYTQVLWYRGGAHAWHKAGMPLTGRVPVAVLR